MSIIRGTESSGPPELTPAVLDQVRGIVWSHANRDQDFLAPVSSTLVHFALKRRGRTWLPSEPLRALARVKDVQPLGDGFWLPVSTFLVRVGGICLVCSGLPTAFLERDLSLTTTGAGLSRLVSASAILTQFPSRELSDWMEAPTSTADWTRQCLRSAKFQEPFGLDGMEVFRHWKASGTRRWLPIADSELPHTASALGRHKAPSGATNHYLLRIQSSGITGIHELRHDGDSVRRVQIGLRRMAGDPERFWITRSADATVELHTPPLPRAERRLLDALGPVVVDSEAGRLQVNLPEGATDTTVQVLAALGLEFRSSHE